MKKIKVEIANVHGHEELMMDEKEVKELIRKSPEHWVFLDNKMVAREHIVSMNLGDTTHVRLMPALVGGAGIPQSPDEEEDRNNALIVENSSFAGWRHDGIPGHNASLTWLSYICEESNALVQPNPAGYEGRKVLIDLEGKSGSLYRIEVVFNENMADALAEKLGWGNREYKWKNRTLDCDLVEVTNPFVTDIQRLLNEITLYKINVQTFQHGRGYWTGICIQARHFPEHGADAVAAIVMALNDDMESAKLPEMDTLRNSLIDNMLTSWVFHPRPRVTFEEASDYIKEIVKIKRKPSSIEENEGISELFNLEEE